MNQRPLEAILPLRQLSHAQLELSPLPAQPKSLESGAKQKSNASTNLLLSPLQVSLIRHHAQPAAFSSACDPHTSEWGPSSTKRIGATKKTG